MAGPTPIVRQIVLCEQATYSPEVGYTLFNPRVDFVVERGERFPAGYPELWLFIQVTGSYEKQRFVCRLVDVTDPTVAPVAVFETPERMIDLGKPLGSYRLRSKSWAIKLTRVLFPHAGRYEFWVMFDGLVSSKVDILVEALP
jgi:hypothetical protein